MVLVEPGHEYVYRESTFAKSQHVRVIEVERRPRSTRVEIEFLEGADAGTRRQVPGGRLRAPWAEVVGFDELWANWARLASDEYEQTRAEEFAVVTVFESLIPPEVAECGSGPVRDSVAIRDRVALEKILDVSLDDLLSRFEHFDTDGSTFVSPSFVPLMCELACRANPMPILDVVRKEEEEKREECKRVRTIELFRGEERTIYPEQSYASYLELWRPTHELLRQWCGHRAVTFQERLTAAEAEVKRLEGLLIRTIDIVKRSDERSAEWIEREMDTERILPENVRPVVDRPIPPNEREVVYVKTRGRRWW